MALGAVQGVVVGSNNHPPRRTGVCGEVPSGKEPHAIGQYNVNFSQKGDLTNNNSKYYTTFKREETFKTIKVTITDTVAGKNRRYDLSIDYKSSIAKDSLYYFKLISDKGVVVKTFYLSYQDTCYKEFGMDPLTTIDSVEMYEY